MFLHSFVCTLIIITFHMQSLNEKFIFSFYFTLFTQLTGKPLDLYYKFNSYLLENISLYIKWICDKLFFQWRY